MSDIPESAPISLPTIEPKTVDPKGQTLSNEQRQIISRCITKSNAAIDAERLRARIAELEEQVNLHRCASCGKSFAEHHERIAAQAKVVEAAKEIPTTDLGPGPYVYVNIRELEALGKALDNLRRVEEGK